MIIRWGAVIMVSLLAAACASTQTILPQTQIIDRPALNEITTAELGETVIEKGRLRTYQGLALANELQWGDGIILKKFTLSPGELSRPPARWQVHLLLLRQYDGARRPARHQPLPQRRPVPRQ